LTRGEPRTVFAALSGGVDSSTAAALLVQQGYEVHGITMCVSAPRDDDEAGDDDSGPTTSVDLARQVCSVLGIPFHLVDLRRQFRETVVDYLCESYLHGITPNPCIVCNQYIKFGALMQAARDLGAQYLATGHYAQVHDRGGEYELRRAVDRNKDQSYMLYRLGQSELAATMFPVGGLVKAEVRAMAQQMGLPTAQRAESQDLCFVQGGDYRRLLQARWPASLRPGSIVDAKGKVLGQHQGIAAYTIGQRQGLGLAAAAPLYVLKIDVENNVLVVGPQSAAGSTELIAEQVHYVSGDLPSQAVSVVAKVRYRAGEAGARLVPVTERTARVIFEEPQFAVTPGQSVVFYQGDVVLGGGVIVSTLSAEE
jgi:tRNA-uridine 2-sulfurtransferase